MVHFRMARLPRRARVLTSRLSRFSRVRVLLLLVSTAIFIKVLTTGQSRAPPAPQEFRFALTDTAAYVPDTPEHFTSVNYPTSEHRPQNQFWRPVPKTLGVPAFVVVTIVTNSTELLESSYRSLAQSSLSEWRWIILGREGDQTPTHLAARDPRVSVIHIDRTEARTSALNRALAECISSGAPAAAFLEPGAMFEHTTMEKATWALVSVPSWDIAGHFWAVYGDEDAVHTTGVHSGALNLERDMIAPSSTFRVSAVKESGCLFHHPFMSELWLCLAAAGHWGGTIPEVGTWEPSVVPGTSLHPAETVSSRWSHLQKNTFTFDAVPRSVPLELVSWAPPYQTFISPQPEKSIMIIQGWLLVGGSELGFLDVLRHFASEGYRVTMVLTRLKYPEGLALRAQVAKYTNDIHTLPAFLRMPDFPRYIKALIDSRGIQAVLMSNSQLIYHILPALAEQTPGTQWIDYLHNEAYDGWKTYGFPSFSLMSRRHLTRTLTCSEYLRSWLIERGYPADRVGVSKLGVDISRFAMRAEDAQLAAKAKILAPLDPATTLLLSSSARLDSQKRPLLVPEIIYEVQQRLPADCPIKSVVMIMMGDGPLRDPLEEKVKALGLVDTVWLTGTVKNPGPILQGTDVFLLPSAIEGISIAVAEAMAVGVPIISTHAGGLPEQLGDLGNRTAVAGRLIPLSGTDAIDVAGYADAVLELACDNTLRRSLGLAARNHVASTFNQDKTLPTFVDQLVIALAAPKPSVKNTPNPVAYLGLQDLATEEFHLVDVSATQKQLSKLNLEDQGGQLERRCGGTSADWLSALSSGSFCDHSRPEEHSWLFKSAMEQCGAWCIWDLRSMEAVGWYYNGQCVDSFQKGSMQQTSCSDYFHYRPPFTFIHHSRSTFA